MRTTTKEQFCKEKKEAFDTWLNNVGFEQYKSLFEKQKIDDVTFLNHLTDEHMANIGMSNPVHRLKFIAQCKNYISEKNKLVTWIQRQTDDKQNIADYYANILEVRGIYGFDKLLSDVDNKETWMNLIQRNESKDKLYAKYHNKLWKAIEKERNQLEEVDDDNNYSNNDNNNNNNRRPYNNETDKDTENEKENEKENENDTTKKVIDYLCQPEDDDIEYEKEGNSNHLNGNSNNLNGNTDDVWNSFVKNSYST